MTVRRTLHALDFSDDADVSDNGASPGRASYGPEGKQEVSMTGWSLVAVAIAVLVAGNLAWRWAESPVPASLPGVDVQSRMIELLEANADRGGIANLRGLVADAPMVDLPRGHFDVAFLALALGEIPAREEALARCYEYLKPGGRLSITEYFPDPHFVPRAKVREVAEGAQAGVVRTTSLARKRWAA